METRIKLTGEQTELILSDEQLENDNFVDLVIVQLDNTDKTRTVPKTIEVVLPLDEFMSALQGFSEKRKRLAERDRLYENK